MKNTKTVSKDFQFYPAVLDEAFDKTMENYRRYVAVRNFEASEKNQAIKEYNRDLKKNNSFSKDFDTYFKNKYRHLGVEAYNEKVNYYRPYNVLILKRKFKIIKYIQEVNFIKKLNP